MGTSRSEPSVSAQAPRNHPHAFRQAHRAEHLWSKDARVADLCPLAQVGVVSKDFHARLRVRIEGRLETKLRDADLGEEGPDRPNEVA
eukprot:scaffold7340_cov266-Pinguiococcus_pyrenoidosus.AAC.55